jgi:hypothetical protein
MKSGAFVMLIIRPAQSQFGGRTYGVTTKTLDHVVSLEIAPRSNGYATIIPIYGQFPYNPELPRNTRVNLCFEMTNVAVSGWSFRKPHKNPDSRIPFQRCESTSGIVITRSGL